MARARLYVTVVLTFRSLGVCDHLMKAIEQYIAVVLFIMLYKVVLTFVITFESVKS